MTDLRVIYFLLWRVLLDIALLPFHLVVFLFRADHIRREIREILEARR